MGSFLSAASSEIQWINGIGDDPIRLPPKQTISLILCRWLIKCRVKSIFPLELQEFIINECIFHPFLDHNPRNESGSLMNFDFAIRLLFIGDSGVGKRSLIYRYVYDCYPFVASPLNQLPNNPIFRFVTVKSEDSIGYETIRLQMHYIGYSLVSVQDQYLNIGPHGVILCYDISNWNSLQSIHHHNAECRRFDKSSLFRVLVGTKCDLKERGYEQYRGREEADAIAAECGLDYVRETSAKNNVNVESLFGELITQIVDVLQKRETFPFYG